MASTTYKVQAQFPATTAVPVKAYVSNKAITTNLATITTNAAHGITQVGTLVQLQGIDATFDGTYTVNSVPTTTSFTFVSTTATVSSAAVSPTGVATFTPVTSGFTVSNKVVQNYVATLTTGSAHGFSVGDYVAVTIGDTIYNTLQAQIIAVPTTTTFSYVVTTQTASTTSVSQGSVGKTTAQSSYTVAGSTQGVSSTLYVANASTSIQYYRIAVQKGGASLANQWIAYDVPIGINATTAYTTGLALNAGEILTVQASSNLVTFTLDGSETA
jgi:hypothetical protein